MKKWIAVAAFACAAAAVVGVAGAANQNYNAHLVGANEVPARDTLAQGQASLKVSNDGLSLECTLIASNINNVVQAHIHLGPAGANGPVVAFIYGAVPPNGGAQDGVLSQPTITAANLIGPLAGQPLSALISEIEAGNAYVNVHTDDGVAPANTGPGDFPGGEIRGQLP
jgi:CHRD domain